MNPLIVQSEPVSSTGIAIIVRAMPQAAPFAVAATSITQSRSGNVTIATATTSLTGTVYFFWYLDGLYVGSTTSTDSGQASHTFALSPTEQARIDVLTSNSPDFDPVANAPAAWPARRMLVFTRSFDANVVRYRIEQQKAAGAWSQIGMVQHDPRRWIYQFLTPRLDDLTQYAWRITPLDAAGQAGTLISLPAELIVRTPDAPTFTLTFNSGTARITFS